MSDYDGSFPVGAAIFFRFLGSDGMLIRSVHPKGRYVQIGNVGGAHEEDYVVLDENRDFLAAFPRDFVAAILPLETTGPGTTDASNQQKPPVN